MLSSSPTVLPEHGAVQERERPLECGESRSRGISKRGCASPLAAAAAPSPSPSLSQGLSLVCASEDSLDPGSGARRISLWVLWRRAASTHSEEPRRPALQIHCQRSAALRPRARCPSSSPMDCPPANHIYGQCVPSLRRQGQLQQPWRVSAAGMFKRRIQGSGPANGGSKHGVWVNCLRCIDSMYVPLLVCAWFLPDSYSRERRGHKREKREERKRLGCDVHRWLRV